MRDKYDFLCEDKHRSVLQAASIILLAIARYSQRTQNSKFLISLQYLKKQGRDEVYLLHADKHQVFLQVGPINLGWPVHACPNDRRQQVCKIFVISQERGGDEVEFLCR